MTKSDDLQFENLVMANFRARHYDDASLARGLCKFISEKVLPDFNPITDKVEQSLFRCLVLVLAVDSSASLESESVSVFRKLLELHPDYAINLLRESLQYIPSQHKPYVWRLLASHLNSLPQTDPLVIEAQHVQVQCNKENNALYREVSRFIERVCPATASAP